MSKIESYLIPDWPAPSNIRAFTTLRNGGVSAGSYENLNVGLHVGDDGEHVKQNRQIITRLLALPSEPIWLDQVHSDRVVKALKTPKLQQADASYSIDAGVVCAVMTADCLPLLVCSKKSLGVAAIHAGWRGLLAGVIVNTIVALRETLQGSDNEDDVWVWLGPAIGPGCFEVGDEVRTAFLNKAVAFSSAFKAQGHGKWLADIYQLARIELASIGIADVYGGEFCTFTEHERFYSYRRDAQTGRMATLIWRE